MSETKIVSFDRPCKPEKHEKRHDGCDCRADRMTIGGNGSKKHPFEVITNVNIFVFRPGDPAGNRNFIFTDWDSLYAALQEFAGQPVTLQFDDRFVFPAPAVIPAGTWNMFNVEWTGVPDTVGGVLVELADGARIVLLPVVGDPLTGGGLLAVRGFGFQVQSDRKGPVAPFDNSDGSFGGIVCSEGAPQFFNTDPAALPMFVAANFGMTFIFDGSASRGLLAAASVSAPLVDLAGNTVFILLMSGDIENNVFTDSVGGGILNINVFDDSTVGDTLDAWSFPALPGSSIVLIHGGAEHYTTAQQTRSRIGLDSGGGPLIVTPAQSPYAAAYNELVLVDTTTGTVTINFPTAAPAVGEHIIVKDRAGNAGANLILTVPAAGNTIENPNMSTAFGSKTWICDGLGQWNLVAVV